MLKKILLILIIIILLAVLLYNESNRSGINMKENEKHKIVVNEYGTYIDGFLIVNKTYSISKDYTPDSYEIITDSCPKCLDKKTYDAFLLMQKDAEKHNLKIWIQSGYRSYEYQKKIYNNYVNKDDYKKADTYSARPGHSEHQTGLCFDLNSVSDEFADTPEGKWIDENCWKYGYCVRFPKGKDEYTGYKYESWHLRYVGTELAKKLYNNGDWISLEEFFGLPSEYPQ